MEILTCRFPLLPPLSPYTDTSLVTIGQLWQCQWWQWGSGDNDNVLINNSGNGPPCYQNLYCCVWCTCNVQLRSYYFFLLLNFSSFILILCSCSCFYSSFVALTFDLSYSSIDFSINSVRPPKVKIQPCSSSLPILVTNSSGTREWSVRYYCPFKRRSELQSSS